MRATAQSRARPTTPSLSLPGRVELGTARRRALQWSRAHAVVARVNTPRIRDAPYCRKWTDDHLHCAAVTSGLPPALSDSASTRLCLRPHSYPALQFLPPTNNKRKDKYGGTLEKPCALYWSNLEKCGSSVGTTRRSPPSRGRTLYGEAGVEIENDGISSSDGRTRWSICGTWMLATSPSGRGRGSLGRSTSRATRCRDVASSSKWPKAGARVGRSPDRKDDRERDQGHRRPHRSLARPILPIAWLPKRSKQAATTTFALHRLQCVHFRAGKSRSADDMHQTPPRAWNTGAAGIRKHFQNAAPTLHLGGRARPSGSNAPSDCGKRLHRSPRHGREDLRHLTSVHHAARTSRVGLSPDYREFQNSTSSSKRNSIPGGTRPETYDGETALHVRRLKRSYIATGSSWNTAAPTALADPIPGADARTQPLLGTGARGQNPSASAS